jgi:hypothetical protein
LYWYRRPYEGRRDADWLVEQAMLSLALAQERADSATLNQLVPRLRRSVEQNPDDGDPRRRFDPRRFTRDRVVFAWCFLWARVFDAPGRGRMRERVEWALAQDQPIQQ